MEERFTKEYDHTAKLNAEVLRQEIADALSKHTENTVRPEDIDVMQDAALDPVVTPILVTFATKVAYDLWSRVVLPRLEKKYGATALTER